MANVFQTLNDSAAGVVIGTALHTLGAIGLLGGLIGYVAWHRHLHRGHHHAKVLNFATFLTYVSILANLLGGFMRTYETGHPSITEFGSSAWVRAISIKHLFIFLGMGAAIVLFERIAPRHIRAMKAGTLQEESMTTHALGVLLVALGIVVAALLGAVSTVLPVAMADGGDGGMGGDGDGTLVADAYHNATGQLVSTPVAPGESTSSFEVPAGSTDLHATLLWTPTVANLQVAFRTPSGNVAFAVGGSGGRQEGSLGDMPQPGRWTYSVTTPDPVASVDWELSVRMPQAAGNQSIMSGTVVVAPGAVNFYEINTVSPLGGTLHWDWSASAEVHFDVHSHFDDEVQYPVTMTASAHAGSYTNEREGGYSYLWQNDGAVAVTVTYRVWGDWELDSVFPA